MENKNLLEIRNLNVNYGDSSILRDVSLAVKPGEIIGLVGESGCGKSTLIHTTMGILGKGGYVTGGEIKYQGKDILSMSKEETRRLRGEEISLISQNPIESFHPTRKIKTQLIEMVKMHGMNPKEAEEEMLRLMSVFRLNNPKRILNSYAFELSGGMCQRVSIAMSIVLRPKILMADEPTSALDVITQKEVIGELMKVRDSLGTAIVIVSHNMGVISHMADKMLVMYAGSVFEYGKKDQVIRNSHHPYTRNLVAAVPKLGQPLPSNISVASIDRTIEGCPYCNGCKECGEGCDCHMPPLVEMEPGYFVRCHIYCDHSGQNERQTKGREHGYCCSGS